MLAHFNVVKMVAQNGILKLTEHQASARSGCARGNYVQTVRCSSLEAKRIQMHSGTYPYARSPSASTISAISVAAVRKSGGESISTAAREGVTLGRDAMDE